MPSPPQPTIQILISDHTSHPPITQTYISISPSPSPPKTLTLSLPTLHTSLHHLSTSPTPSLEVEKFWSTTAPLLDYTASFLPTDTPQMQSIWFHHLTTWRRIGLHIAATDAVFAAQFSATLDLLRRIVGEKIVHAHGTPESWVVGVQAWGQFLVGGSPGCADYLYPLAEAQGEEVEGDGKGRGRVRYIPAPALAIIHAHTQRAVRLSSSSSLPQDAGPLPTLTFPSPSSPSASTTTSTGTYTYRLLNGAHAIRRYVGYGDPGMLVGAPGLNLVDECVGVCRGVGAYGMVSGVVSGGGGEGEAFDMWAVWEGEGTGKDGNGWGELFGAWCEEDI
ncbi:hypothetical protein P153DRAFT_394101 [Dothidotthia symphoricarpi CBS 119687]|uniref:Uncharacterized protein n=1 Tax=Dothidotthia symphoricarpi CBS 119687 TaxID=1392245 RepID=A0A6A6ALG1_9PLEO|nr:uncharacterized protein P153DRAFT_394101 [Dothidotthia symphoricarpi CBS 119687]KAF2131915.1 hypothetical protein P153DRAFT_394101 [Dothidotthia symphoricarpi CBS 119687]